MLLNKPNGLMKLVGLNMLIGIYGSMFIAVPGPIGTAYAPQTI